MSLTGGHLLLAPLLSQCVCDIQLLDIQLLDDPRAQNRR
jgi:hypothetical protein